MITRGRQPKPAVNTFEMVRPLGVSVTTPQTPAVPPAALLSPAPMAAPPVAPAAVEPLPAPVPVIDPIAGASFESRKAEFDPNALVEVASGSGVEMGPFIVERSEDNNLNIRLKTGPGLGQKADWFVSELQSGDEKLLVTAVRYHAEAVASDSSVSPPPTLRPGAPETTHLVSSVEPIVAADGDQATGS